MEDENLEHKELEMELPSKLRLAKNKNLLVIGNASVGKSTLINLLYEKDISSINKFDFRTKRKGECFFTISNPSEFIEVRIFEASGLTKRKTKKEIGSYCQKILSECSFIQENTKGLLRLRENHIYDIVYVAKPSSSNKDNDMEIFYEIIQILKKSKAKLHRLVFVINEYDILGNKNNQSIKDEFQSNRGKELQDLQMDEIYFHRLIPFDQFRSNLWQKEILMSILIEEKKPNEKERMAYITAFKDKTDTDISHKLNISPVDLNRVSIKVKQDMELKNLLIEIVNLSRTNKLIWEAAANSMTILYASGITLSGQNLRDVCIGGIDVNGEGWGANLPNSILDDSDFTNADIRYINLLNSSLNNTVFANSKMFGVKFDQLSDKVVSSTSPGDQTSYANEFNNINLKLYRSKFASVDENSILFWELKTGHCVAEIKEKSQQIISYISYCEWLVTYDKSNLNIWNVVTRKCLASFPFEKIDIIDFYSDTNYFAIVHREKKEINIYRLTQDFFIVPIKCLAGDGVVKFSNNGKYFALAHSKKIHIYNTSSFDTQFTLKGHDNDIICLSFSANATFLVSSSKDGTIKIWDFQQEKCVKTINLAKLPKEGHNISTIALHPQNKYMAASNFNGLIKVWELQTYRCVAVIDESKDYPTNSVTWSENGKYLIAVASNHRIKVWRAISTLNIDGTFVLNKNGTLKLIAQWANIGTLSAMNIDLSGAYLTKEQFEILEKSSYKSVTKNKIIKRGEPNFVVADEIDADFQIFKLTTCDDQGFSLLHHACLEGNLNKIELYVKKGAILSQLTDTGLSMLDLAVQAENSSIVEWLLKQNVNFPTTSTTDLIQFCQAYTIRLALLVYKRLHPELQKEIEYWISEVIRSTHVSEWEYKDRFSDFLQYTINQNQEFQYAIRQLSTDNLLKNYKKKYLIDLLQKNIFESNMWAELKQSIEYASLSLEEESNICLYLNYAVIQSLEDWYPFFNEKERIQLQLPNDSQKIVNQFKVRHAHINSKNILHQQKVSYPSFPLDDLKVLLELSQTFDLDKLLPNTGQPNKDWSWLKNYIIKKLQWKENDHEFRLINSMDSAAFKKIVKTAWDRLRVFKLITTIKVSGIQDAIVSGLQFDNGMNAINKLKDYLAAFTVDSTIQYEEMIVSLLKDKILYEFLISSSPARQHLVALAVSAKIQDLDQFAIENGLDVFTRLQRLVQTQEIEVNDYFSLIMCLVNNRFRDLHDVINRAHLFAEQIERLVKVFLQPQLFTMAQLLQPILQQALEKAERLVENIQQNIPIDNNLTIERIFRKDEKVSIKYINTDKLFEEAINNGRLGFYVNSPVTDALVYKQLQNSIFSGPSASISDSQAIVGSFKGLALNGYYFNDCKFHCFSIASSFLENCHFNNAKFYESIDFTETVVDAKTAHSLLTALYYSDELNQAQSKPLLKVTGKLIVVKGQNDDVVPVAGRWIKYIDQKNIKEPAILKSITELSTPIFENEHKAEFSQSENPAVHQEEQQSFCSKIMGGLFSLFPGKGTLNEVGQYAFETIKSCINQPELILSGRCAQDDAERQEADKAIQQLNTKLEELKQELGYLKANNKMHFQTIDSIAGDQDNLQIKIDNYGAAITRIENAMDEINHYWKEKKKIANKKQRIINNSGPAVRAFYQTFLSELSGTFLALFLLQNQLQLITTEKGKITNITKRGGVFQSAREHLGLLEVTAKHSPGTITHAYNCLERGTDSLLIYAQKILKLKNAVSLIPQIGQAVNGFITLAEMGVNSLLEKKDKKTLSGIKYNGQGATPKNLEKLADATACRITLAFLEPISVLTEEGGRLLGRCGALRVIVALLNQRLGHLDDFSLEALIALRELEVSKFANLLSGDFISKPLPLANTNGKRSITERDVYQRSGVCYISKKEKKLCFYSNNANVDIVREIGYMKISENEWDQFFHKNVSLDSEPLSKQSVYLYSPSKQTSIESNTATSLHSLSSDSKLIQDAASEKRIVALEMKYLELESIVQQLQKHMKYLGEEFLLSEKIHLRSDYEFQQHSSKYGNMFYLDKEFAYEKKLNILKCFFQEHFIDSHVFYVKSIGKTIFLKALNSDNFDYYLLGHVIFLHLNLIVVDVKESVDEKKNCCLIIQVRATLDVKNLMLMLCRAGLRLAETSQTKRAEKQIKADKQSTEHPNNYQFLPPPNRPLAFVGPTENIVQTKGGGNCLFNACALGICELFEASQFPTNEAFDIKLAKQLNLSLKNHGATAKWLRVSENSIKTKQFSTNTTSNINFSAKSKSSLKNREAILSWLNFNKNLVTRQDAIQHLLRKIAIEYIQENYETVYKSEYHIALWAAYQNFLQKDESDDTFRVHPTIKNKFSSSADLSQTDLFDWWEENYKNIYFKTLCESALGSMDEMRYGSELELGALASSLCINIRWKKELNTQGEQLGIGSGLIKGLKSEEITLLVNLGIGSRYQNSLKIGNFYNKEALQQRLKPLPEKEVILRIISDNIFCEKDIFNKIQLEIQDTEKLYKELERRNVITRRNDKTYGFIKNDSGTVIDKEEIAKRLSGLTDDKLIQEIDNNFHEHVPEFTVIHKGKHWSYVTSRFTNFKESNYGSNYIGGPKVS